MPSNRQRSIVEKAHGHLTGAVAVLLAAGWSREQIIAVVDEVISEEEPSDET